MTKVQTDMNVKFTPPDLIKRMEKYPDKLNEVMKLTATAALLILHENVPAYPDKFPNQVYDRTGNLGASLGVGMTGRKIGKPDIYTVRQVGPPGGYQATFGTKIHYGPDVIGAGTQKPLFVGRWWTMETIAKRSTAKIIEAYEAAARQLVDFLSGR